MTKTGLGASSQNLTGLSVMIAGKNTLGFTDDSTKVPEFEFETINEESTGIVKPPKMTLGLKNLGQEYLAHIVEGNPFVLKGNIHEGDEDKALLITIQGQLHKMSSELKEGDSTKREFELRVDLYEETVDGQQTITYNRNPYKLILAGVDTAPNFNNNI